jgi:phosphomannomutase
MRCYVEAEDETAASSLLEKGLSLVRDWAKSQ